MNKEKEKYEKVEESSPNTVNLNLDDSDNDDDFFDDFFEE